MSIKRKTGAEEIYAKMDEDLSKYLFTKSAPMPEGSIPVMGYDFNNGIDHHKLLQSYYASGFQAMNFGLAVKEVNTMLLKRKNPPVKTEDDEFDWESVCGFNDEIKTGCTIFLGYTSNMVSCGVRETIRYLVEHKLVDAIVTTCGAIEEDIIKCYAPTYLGDFAFKGKDLREKGHNRIGNLIIPHDNYGLLDKFLDPVIEKMFKEQEEQGKIWTPSMIIEEFGKAVDNKSSVLYWAAKNKIPVFCPALTDGAIGDMMFGHFVKGDGITIDIARDICRLNVMSIKSATKGMMILGGGVVKHHINNANLIGHGADHSVNINTGTDYDGSDAGARPDEAVSWGKIKTTAKPVKIYAEASLVFPLLVAETFARFQQGLPIEGRTD